MVTAITMTYADEAIGIAQAAGDAGLPAVISFTLETDGRLPSGQELGDAIEQVDAATDPAPAYYMINCAHPTHFEAVLDGDAAWTRPHRRPARQRLDQEPRRAGRGRGAGRGRPGRPGRASRRALRDKLPRLTVLGGCCGTDHRHVGEIIRGLAAPCRRSKRLALPPPASALPIAISQAI